jgi:hypothetical protein
MCNGYKLEVSLIFAHTKNFASGSFDNVVKIPSLAAVYSWLMKQA